jgi:hypothetical protein
MRLKMAPRAISPFVPYLIAFGFLICFRRLIAAQTFLFAFPYPFAALVIPSVAVRFPLDLRKSPSKEPALIYLLPNLTGLQWRLPARFFAYAACVATGISKLSGGEGVTHAI